MLNSNHGQLSPNLWEALYLSMDLPTNVSHAAHNVFTAIPRNFLAHLRHATAMPVHCTRKQPVETGMCHLSSKIRALLSDLPRDELSVVFASSKTTIQHLLAVFERENIGCRGLYTGQTEKDSEMAVSEWKSDENILVLLVQAGAAACGLTLTAASKMFLLEPFLKHEVSWGKNLLHVAPVGSKIFSNCYFRFRLACPLLFVGRKTSICTFAQIWTDQRSILQGLLQSR